MQQDLRDAEGEERPPSGLCLRLWQVLQPDFKREADEALPYTNRKGLGVTHITPAPIFPPRDR